MYIEYHELFKNKQQANDNDGYTLTVTGMGKGMSLPDKHITAAHITKLIDPVTGMFVSQMRFDDWLFNIEKIEVDLTSKVVSMFVIQKL